MIINKRVAIAVLAGLGIAGLAGASASTLGALDSESVGSGSGTVASCDSDGIDITYSTAYDASAEEYLVDGVTFSDVAADCDGLEASATLRDGSAELETVAGTIDLDLVADPTNDSFSLAVTPGISAEDFDAISLVIEG